MTAIVSTLFASFAAAGTTTAATAATGAAATAATGAAATAATGAGASIFSGSTFLTLLEGVGTAFSALATINAGKSEKALFDAKAEEEDFRAEDERIKGELESARLKRELARTLSRNAVAFAAGGVDLGSQSVKEAKRQVTQDAERELGTAKTESLRATFARRRQANVFRAAGESALNKAKSLAIGKVASFGLKAFQRG